MARQVRGLLLPLVLGVLATSTAAARAQVPTTKIPRIGVLRIGAPIDPSADALRQGLRDLGYAEGHNILIEDRWAEGRLERLPELAADLVRLPVDVIVSGGIVATRAAKGATTTIPIVMQSTDPLGVGLVASLARPGGNITGVATLESELGAKRLEFFKEAFPTVARVAVLYDPTTSPSVLKEVEAAAPGLKMSLHVLKIRAREDLSRAFDEATQWRAAALSVLASPFFQSERILISRLSLEHRLPSMVPHRTYAEAGGFMSYGPDFRDLLRRTAVFVDKILKGATPADLPIEQATKFELVINKKTAKALGLTIPQSLLLRADQVLE